MDKPEALKEEHRQLLKHMRRENLQLIHADKAYSWFMVNTSMLVSPSLASDLENIVKIAGIATRISVLDYTNVHIDIDCNITEYIRDIYSIKHGFDLVFSNITCSSNFHQKWNVGKLHAHAYGNLHLIPVSSTSAFVLTHAHLAGLRDMYNSWVDVLIYSQVNRSKYKGHDLYKDVVLLIQLYTDYSKSGQHCMADVLKAWPSLAIATILRDTENDPRFLNSLLSGFAGWKQNKLILHLTSTIKDDADVHKRLELSGLWKCFGHPVINMDTSVNSWLEKGAVLKEGLEKKAEEIANMFKLNFCKQYYKEKKTWPPVTYNETTSHRVQACIDNNCWREPQGSPWLSREFRGVHLSQTFQFDYHVDLADLLSDKSIIPARDQWIHEYDRQVHRTRHGFFPRGPRPTSKSVIVHYLSMESVSVEEIIKLIDLGVCPDNWRVIVAVPKEKEQKYDNARMYANMPFEMRLYQTATESNLASQIFPYVPQQTMTMSEEQLLKTVSLMNNPVSPVEGVEYKFIVIDFSSWCTNFRWESVLPLFKELDHLFGFTNVYQFTQLFPMISVLLFQDRFNPPKQRTDNLPESGPRCYYGAEAWQEGLRQKGWTLLTIQLIQLAAETCGTSATLIGQGDNHVVLLRLPPRDILTRLQMTKESYIDYFVTELTNQATQLGMVVKGDETWRSSNLFEYSREYHFRGTQVSAALKRISRLASESNQSVPTLNGDLAGLYSTGTAAASKDITPIAAFFCTTVEAAHLIRQRMPWLMREPLERTAVGLCISRILGGLPVSLYSQFCTRSVQDILTTNLRLCKTIRTIPSLYKWVSCWTNLTKAPNTDYEALIKDPQSLPILIPSAPENILRKEVKRGVESVVLNRDVKALFTAKMEDSKALLIRDLMSIRPVNPRLLNKLFSLSNPGLQERYLGKFSNTRSIQQIAFKRWANEEEVLAWVARLENVVSRHYQNQACSTLGDNRLVRYLEGCTLRAAYQMRKDYWGIELEGICMPAQQEQSVLYRWGDVKDEWVDRAILITVDETVNIDPVTHKGRRAPYFGSTTKLRARKAPLQVLEVGSMVASIKQLMELHGWVKGNKCITALIEAMIEEKTAIPVSTLEKYTRQVYSGTLSHRLTCPALRIGGMANQNITFSTHVLINSDTATLFAKQGTNYTICFQSCFLTSISTLSQYQELGVNISGHWASVFTCEGCTAVIPEETFVMNENHYAGVTLPQAITHLTPKFQPAVIKGYTPEVRGSRAYSVHMARKFTSWMLSFDQVSFVTSLDNRSMEDTMIAPFVNLTEFKHLDTHQFIGSLLYYLCLYSDVYYFTPSLVWYPLLDSGPEKIPFDVLIDSLLKCEIFGSFITKGKLEGTVITNKYTLREMIAETLANALLGEPDNLILTNSILTPEDTDNLFVKSVNMQLRAHGETNFLSHGITTAEALSQLKSMCQDHNKFLPIMAVSEEEAVAFVRSQFQVVVSESPSVVTALSVEVFRPIEKTHPYMKQVVFPTIQDCLNPTVYPLNIY